MGLVRSDGGVDGAVAVLGKKMALCMYPCAHWAAEVGEDKRLVGGWWQGYCVQSIPGRDDAMRYHGGGEGARREVTAFGN